MIDFNKFTTRQSHVVPILNNEFQYNRKKYPVSVTNGWYQVTVSSNTVYECTPIIAELGNFPNKYIIKGYTYNDKIVFQNFDVAKRKVGFPVMTKLEFNQSPNFSSIEAIIWEDKNVYYFKPNYEDVLIYEVRSKFNSEENPKEIKGISPELKTLYLFHDIERQQLKEMQRRLEEEATQKQREKELEEYKQTLQGRLITTFNRAGAQILNYSISRDRITVDWKLTGTHQEFNSIIELESFRVIESGYCLSGSDRHHSAQSMIQLAQDYDEKGLIYKTRQ